MPSDLSPSPKFLNRRSRSSYLGIFRKRRIVYFVVVLVICILCFASISFDSTPSSTGHFYLKKRDVLLNKFDPDQPELVSNKAGLVVLDLLDAEEGLKRHPIEDLIKVCLFSPYPLGVWCDPDRMLCSFIRMPKLKPKRSKMAR